MQLLLSRLPENPKERVVLNEMLPNKKIINQTAWEKINAKEISEGEKVGKPRRKIVSIAELLKIPE
jgi:hypothetical protein